MNVLVGASLSEPHYESKSIPRELCIYVCIRLSVNALALQFIGQSNISLPLISIPLDNFITMWSNRSSSLEKAEHWRVAWCHAETRQGTWVTWCVKHLREQRDAEPDKARHMREQEQCDTLRQRKSGMMLRQSNSHERARTVTYTFSAKSSCHFESESS